MKVCKNVYINLADLTFNFGITKINISNNTMQTPKTIVLTDLHDKSTLKFHSFDEFINLLKSNEYDLKMYVDFVILVLTV